MSTATSTSFTGGCTCGYIRYRLLITPLIVHCCHCRWCQRETGAAFAINAWYETTAIEMLPSAITPQTTPETAPNNNSNNAAGSSPIGAPTPRLQRVPLPSESQKPQLQHRCPRCKICLWSNYGGTHSDVFRFVRVGTLDPPAQDDECFEPDAHIFTESKLPWVVLPEEGARAAGKKKPVQVFGNYYRRSHVWSPDALERFARARARARAEREAAGQDGKKGKEGAEEEVERKLRAAKIA